MKPKHWRCAWSAEDETYLEDNWGTLPVPQIARHLHRSEEAVVRRAQILQLGSYFEASDCISLHQLFQALGIPTPRDYWESRGLPFIWRTPYKTPHRMIMLEDFWAWAWDNVAFLDFSRFERFALGPEPLWVAGKRAADVAKANAIRTSPWTEDEDERLRHYAAEGRRVEECAQLLRRGVAATRTHARKKGIELPAAPRSRRLMSEEDKLQLAAGIAAGEGWLQLSRRLGRDEMQLRSLVAYYYGTSVLDRVRAELLGAVGAVEDEED